MFILRSCLDRSYIARLENPALFADLIVKANYRVGEIARILGVSPSRLNSTIWRLCHKTPKEVVNDHRLKRSQQLLSNAVPIKVVALETGFSDAHHFCRWFKRQTGVCPSRFLIIRQDAEPSTSKRNINSFEIEAAKK